MPEHVVSTKLARYVIRAADAQGYDVDQLIRDAGLDFNPLEPDPTKVPLTMPASQYNRLYTRVIWLLQDEAFGLNLKQPLPSGTFRMLCMCIIHCDTLESAIMRSSEFFDFCRELRGLEPLNFVPITSDADFAYCHLPTHDDYFEIDSKQNIIGISAYLHIWRRLMSWLIKEPLELECVQLNCPPIKNPERLEELFQCPVKFDQASLALVFNRDVLSRTVDHTEESLRQFLRAAPYEMTQPALGTSDDILAKMRAIVANDIGAEFPTVTEMSEKLNMSVRTLRRRLQDKNTSYQQFKDQTRMIAAKSYLNRPELKINTVAALMGFDEPSTFHRAFKKWTSQTPGEYRQQVQQAQ